MIEMAERSPSLRERVLAGEQMVLQIPDYRTASYFYYKHYIPELGLDGIRERTHALGNEGFPTLTPTDIAQMVPDSSWYLEPGREEAVHGQQHSLRVGIYAEIIAHKMGLDVGDRKLLRAAALIHDIGRQDDEIDPDHGQRSVDRWHELGDVLKEHGIELDPSEQSIVEILCINHEKDYRDVPDFVRQDEQTHGLLKIFMAADALDRYRAPSEEWWPDPTYFEHDTKLRELFEGLMPFAEQFTLYSEYYRLDSPDLTLQEAFVNVCEMSDRGWDPLIITAERANQRRDIS